jgi:hypothetical protein
MLDNAHCLECIVVNLLLLCLFHVHAGQKGVFNLEVHEFSKEFMLFRQSLYKGALFDVDAQFHSLVMSVARSQNLFDNGLVFPSPRNEDIVNFPQCGAVSRFHT